tara:strand:+ start:2897 stop:3934 length:1038 start_codon:yes stop_codon:yes gene_type:complete
MLDKENFFIQDCESLNEHNYRQRVNKSHVFHSLEWMKVVRESLGVKYKIAILKENDIVVATIPFVTYHNLIKGSCALPLQYSGYYSSIVADNDNFKKKILSHFFEYCKKYKLYTQIPELNEIKGYKGFLGYSIYKINLKQDSKVDEQILNNASKRMRSYTKNAIRSDLVCCTGRLELLDQFYLLYLQNMNELGTPPLPKKYFKNIIKYFPKTAKIILVKNENQICSGMFVLKVSKSELFASAISTPRLHQTMQSSHLIYLQAAREAKKMGCSVMNFGRSIDGSGPAIFKKRYGLQVTPLLMYSPDKNWTVTDPSKSILRYVVLIWKKLPIPLSRLLGMILAKHVI